MVKGTVLDLEPAGDLASLAWLQKGSVTEHKCLIKCPCCWVPPRLRCGRFLFFFDLLFAIFV